ncbi:MAG: beta-galactosidase [Candidatus Dormibacteraeota bacterium]|nr:beta-galactosidase [Candidatus Dormibacteraeota bacterium]
MIEIKRRQLLIDGEPRIVMSGEIHYFRVPRDEWANRIASLKEAGCTTVASYIPWLFHELPDGTIDVTGETLPERDVGAFIELCRNEGLWFIARPGPFVMAELKNEGLPYRVYEQHPEIIPAGWDGRPTPTRTVDYLAPAFLRETQRWYEAVLPPIARRLQPRGGNVIAVQLDNEVGMLAWLNNSPDLTDHLIADLLHWVRTRHGEAAARRYPFDLGDPDAWAHAVRSPDERWAAALRVDLGSFMRNRFARYIAALRDFAKTAGIVDVPFLVNIHGTTADGHGGPFPVGISQLVETYAGIPGMVSGSDHYLGEMTLGTTTDLYVMNAFMAAVQDADQPLTSVEFEAGTGDYDNGQDHLYDPTTVDLKTRICVAQGNRLINYYLFAGGINGPLEEPSGDGNDRISFTGERHGTAAPVGPEGQRSLTYAPTARVIAAVNAAEPWLARMNEEHDNLALGLVLDSFMTEYRYPPSKVMRNIVEDLESFRGAGPRKALARSLLLAGYRFGAVDLQHDAIDLDKHRLVALTTSRHLAGDVQERLAAHVHAGGRLLLLGRMPELDLEGRTCRVLSEALGVAPGDVLRASHTYYPSVVAHRWAAPRPETRVGWLQSLHAPDARPVLTDVAANRPCGVEVAVGDGLAVVLAAELPSVPSFFAAAARHLGVAAGLNLQASVPGLFATTTATDDGQRLVHLLNVSGYDCEVRLGLDGTRLHDGNVLTVPARTGRMLPLGLRLPWATVAWASAEIAQVSADTITFGQGLGSPSGATGTVVVMETDDDVITDPQHEIRREGHRVALRAAPHPGPLRISRLPR